MDLHIAEAGSGPMVLLLHGFPECWYSWRHQLEALSNAGFHAVAPDQRGYGTSDAPAAVEDYDIVQLTDDAAGIVEAMDAERAVIVGHDWGSAVAWNGALLRPDRFHAVITMSVPYQGRAQSEPVATMRENFGDDFYIVRFQEPGVADAEMAADVRATMRNVLLGASALQSADGDELPAWLSEADLDVFVESFERSGFSGGINWYRNIDRNWAITPQLATAKVEQPALFFIGEKDLPFLTATPGIDRMKELVPNLTKVVWLEDCGHWTQQERADDVNREMIDFLRTVCG
ncbi:MAG: alpha/beta hydrolase [Chloroflexi bacterium]|nr:alpha/beta hydrolase [Chloroflexota bacterium]